MVDFSKLPTTQRNVVRKAQNHIKEACDLFCCCNSPFGHPKDQTKVVAAFNEFMDKLRNLK